MKGVKHDQTKPRWSLVPWDQLAVVVQVLESGAAKYAPDNWRQLDHGNARYSEAMMRHAVAVMRGEHLDPESGLPHLAHVACCALFALYHSTVSDK